MISGTDPLSGTVLRPLPAPPCSRKRLSPCATPKGANKLMRTAQSQSAYLRTTALRAAPVLCRARLHPRMSGRAALSLLISAIHLSVATIPCGAAPMDSAGEPVATGHLAAAAVSASAETHRDSGRDAPHEVAPEAHPEYARGGDHPAHRAHPTPPTERAASRASNAADGAGRIARIQRRRRSGPQRVQPTTPRMGLGLLGLGRA